MAFSTPDGLTIGSVSYAIAGPTTASGTVDVSQAQTSIEFVVGGLAAGSGYTITLSATTTNGDACSSDPAPFAIAAGTTTQVAVNLVCVLGDGGIVFADAGTGSVEVDATVTTVNRPPVTCPAIAAFSVSPAEEAVGATSAVLVSTFPAGAPVLYFVTPGPGAGGNGTVTNVSPTGATFTCTSPGQVTLTVGATATLPDGSTVLCQKMQAVINCEPLCPPGQTICGAACVDMQSDPANCGTCGHACAVGGLCKAGTCVTLTIEIRPSNVVEFAQGDHFTGAETTISEPRGINFDIGVQQQFVAVGMYSDNSTRYLTASVMWNSSPSSVLAISGSGVAMAQGTGSATVTATDPATNTVGSATVTVGGTPGICDFPSNGSACPCLNGVQEIPCTNGICVDQNWDPQNCGACGNTCGAGESCNMGECVPCPYGPKTLCGGVCTNLRDDVQNCGACGNVCAPFTAQHEMFPFCCFGTCGISGCSGGKCPRACQ
jgi:hypothetical protein